MIRNKLLYALLLIAMVLFYVLYRGTLSLTLLIFAFALPAVLFAYLQILAHSFRAGLAHREIGENGKFAFFVRIQNRSFLSDANALFHLAYSSTLAGTEQELTLNIPVLMRNAQQAELQFRSQTCGVMRLRLTEIELFDPLRIFRKRLKPALTDAVVELPLHDASLSARLQNVPQADADTAEYSREKPGDDPSEIFDLHTYRQGDHVSRIHWKLSSKHDELMVKEYSLPLSAGCLILPDYRFTAQQPEAALRLDAMLSALCTAADRLTEQMMPFRTGVIIPDQGLQRSALVQEYADLQEWLEELIHSNPAPSESKPMFLQELTALMSAPGNNDRLFLFLPRLDREIASVISALPQPERVTVFAVRMNESDAKLMTKRSLPFSCVAVTPAKRFDPNPPSAQEAPDARSSGKKGGEPA